MRKYIWKIYMSRWFKEGQILPWWTLLLRSILFPLDTLFWHMGMTRGYDFRTDTWTIEGVKFSGSMMRVLSRCSSQPFNIKSQNGVITLDLGRKQDEN